MNRPHVPDFDLIGHLAALGPLFDQVYNPILITTAELDLPGPEIIYVNRALCQLTGYSAGELLGQTPRILQGPRSDRRVLAHLRRCLGRNECFQGRSVNYRKDGSEYWVEWNISPVRNSAGTITHYFAVQRDISEHVALVELKNDLLELVDKKTHTINELNGEIESTLRDTLYTLGELVEERCRETGHHVRRVALYAGLLSRLAGLSPEQSELIKLASALHDVGKVTIPDAILHKAGRLDDDEMEVMMEHAANGHAMLKGSERPLFKLAASIALTHHERYDGTGYPNGLARDQIPIEGRIVALADVFDALGSARPYKSAWCDERIVAMLRCERGHHFDPGLVDLFLGHLGEFMAIRDAWRDPGSAFGARRAAPQAAHN